MSIWKTIKEIFSFPPSKDFIWTCLNCNKEFDGAQVELFIKHQIDEKHFDAAKRRKVK